MSGKPFYITTPIYYVNDVPHIGHAYTTIAADVLARFHRLLGDDVFFLTGTDEHGQKIESQAKKNNESPQELSNRVVEKFKEIWTTLNISYDDFIRTTEERHKKTVTNVVNQIIANGDIYLGKYEDWYCVSCETFFTETQLIDGRCPNVECRRSVQKLKEESYFFRMSKYEKRLLDHIDKHPEFIQPEVRRNEVTSFIREGLRDLSVSRTTFEWGIPMPKEASTAKKHVIYVWFEALMNYLSGISYGTDNEKFNRYWSNVTHLVGKDILRFHAVYWPTMLMSIGVPLPTRIFAHGWWTSEGEKISKSKGNVVDPKEMVSKFGLDAFRYFLLREIPFGVDGDFSRKAFIIKTNSDLANDLGNLLSRATNMISRYCDGKTPAKEDFSLNSGNSDQELIELSKRVVSETKKHINEIAYSKALSSIWTLVRSTNQYLEKMAPWRLSKEGKQKEVERTLYNTLESLRISALLLYPFMPDSAARIWKDIGVPSDLNVARDLNAETAWGKLPSGASVMVGSPLFPRLEEK